MCKGVKQMKNKIYKLRFHNNQLDSKNIYIDKYFIELFLGKNICVECYCIVKGKKEFKKLFILERKFCNNFLINNESNFEKVKLNKKLKFNDFFNKLDYKIIYYKNKKYYVMKSEFVHAFFL